MPFYLAKGLEFDAVYIPNAQQYQSSLEKQALYINVTRALHELKLYESEDKEKQKEDTEWKRAASGSSFFSYLYQILMIK